MHAHDSRSPAPGSASRKPDSRASRPHGTRAALHLQSTVGNAAATRYYADRHEAPERSREAPGPVVQRTIAMHPPGTTDPDGADLTTLVGGTADRDSLYEYVRSMADREAGVRRPLTDDEKTAYQKEQPRIKDQLGKWALGAPRSYRDDASTASQAHRSFGSKTQDRHYDDYTSLVRALLGWVGAKEGRRSERKLAEDVHQNPEIDLGLEITLERIRRWVEDGELHDKKNIMRELMDSRTDSADDKGEHWYGHYQKYFDQKLQAMQDVPAEVRAGLRTGIKRDMWRVLEQPERYPVRDKVVVLHDLMEYFGAQQDWNAPTWGTGLISDVDPDSPRTHTTTQVGADNRRADSTPDRGRAPGHASTRNEDAPSTRVARERGIPVWAGSSFTALRMFTMVEQLGGTLTEISAVAYGIFAFWRLDYDHSAKLAPHTLHEVLDIASNFKVDYDLTDPGAGLRENHRPGTVRDGLRSGMERMVTQLDTMDDDLIDMRMGLRTTHGDDTPDEVRELYGKIESAQRRIEQLLENATAILTGLEGIDDERVPAGRKRLREFYLQHVGLVEGLTGVETDVSELKEPSAAWTDAGLLLGT